MKERLRINDHADESLMGPFVFIATFIAVSGFIIGSMGALFAYSAMGNIDYFSGSTFLLGNETYSYIDGSTHGYNVTIADVVDTWSEAYADHEFIFHDDINEDDEHLVMVRALTSSGSMTDEIEVMEAYGWWSDDRIRISYLTLIDYQIPYTNVSIVDFELRSKSYALMIVTPSDYQNHSAYIDENEFYISIVHAPQDLDNIGSVSMWNLIGQMLTAQLPSVHPMLQYLIAVPMWVGIGFIIFTLVSRMIPFIGGG
jgi:hypothetical protein